MNIVYPSGRRLLLLAGLYFGLSFGAFAQCYNLETNQNVPLYLNEDCTGVVNAFYLIANSWTCQGPTTVEYFDAAGNSLGFEVDGSYLGQTLDAFVTHTWSGQTGWGTVVVTDNRGPWLGCENVSLNCTEDPSAAALGPPAVSDNCGSVVSLVHSDETIDLGCGSQGFQDYFDPANWTCTSNAPFNDGEVLTAGAPDSIVLVAADQSHDNGHPQYIKKYYITVPAEGYVAFDWCSSGGDVPGVDAFFITVNNVCIQLSNDSTHCGSYTTPQLQPGDVLSFEQTSNGNATAMHTTVSNFTYLTAAREIINRTWTATDESGNSKSCTQVITIRRATLADVQLPTNLDNSSAPMLGCGADTDPTNTGFPFVDEDGDPSTTNDRFEIQSGDCAFALTYSDELLTVCPGQTLTVRTWTIADWCTDQIRVDQQLIKAFDTEAPIFDPIDPISVDAGGQGCGAFDYTLPLPTATDACTGQATVTAQWAFGTGFGPYDDVPVGTHVVTYTATDPCGNSRSVDVALTVTDRIAPIMVCDGLTSVAVGSDGLAVIPAAAVDNGSSDNCCAPTLDIKLAGAPTSSYGASVTFDCSQLGGLVSVDLRGTDCFGNVNVCTVEIAVEANPAPVLAAPADLTLDCGADLTDLTVYGTATAADNCQVDLTESVVLDVNSCGVGTALRTWTAVDPSGNGSTASQLITVANTDPLTPQITWPADYQTSACVAVPLPAELVPPFSFPLIAGVTDCAQISVNYDDVVAYVAEPACYTVLRTWRIADLCVHQTNDTIGIWTHTQLLEVSDAEAPVFASLPSTLDVPVDANCVATVHLPVPTVTDCSDHLVVDVTSPFGLGFGPFDGVAPGDYTVTYTAHDGCGNSSNATQQVRVRDAKAPTPICRNGIIVDVAPGGTVTVTADQLNLSSGDNCTAAGELRFSFGPDPAVQTLTFDCGQVGDRFVELWVTDAAGNQDYCETFVTVQDAAGHCGAALVDVSGRITTMTDAPLGQATVVLNGGTAVQTDADGKYRFSDQATGSACTVQAAREFGHTDGVTTYDLVLINQHVLGTTPITNPYLLLAADANGSGNISALDVVELQKVILYINLSFTNQANWQFIPADHVFADPLDPFGTPPPNAYDWPSLAVDVTDADFVAIKTGDLNGSINTPNLDQPVAADRNGPLALSVVDRVFAAGEEFTVEVPAADVLALQATLTIDEDWVTLLDTEAAPGARTGRPAPGYLTALWTATAIDNADWLRLRVRARRAGRVSDWLRLAPRYTPALAFAGAQARPLALVFSEAAGPPAIAPGVFPNPLTTESRLVHTVDTPGPHHLRVYAADGRLVYNSTKMWKKGPREWRLRRNELPAAGVYYFQLQSPIAVHAGTLHVQ